MIQYCRYCAYMCCGNGANWCDIKQKEYSDSTIKAPNKCKDFAFCELDALDLVNVYKPRKKKEQNYHQVSIEEILGNE